MNKPAFKIAIYKKHSFYVLALIFLAFIATVPKKANAINTIGVVQNTITAFPSCSAYQVKGVCFWLICKLFYCKIEASIRVSHYVPDVVVSTYNDPLTHPWTDVGKPLATVLQTVGSALLQTPTDSSAGTQRESTEIATFKSADAIGNPAGQIAQILSSGNVNSFSGGFNFPGYGELMKFPSSIGSITSGWASFPAQLGSDMMKAVKNMVQKPMALIGQIQSLPGKISNIDSAIGKLGSVFGGDSSALGVDTGLKAAKVVGIDLGPVKDLMALAQGLGATGGISEFFCPGAASAFNLHFQSDMDALFWRNIIPVEMIYPQTWVPGLEEVSKSPVSNTWGSVYPRVGEVVQSHPVKASAVLASRVASIIKQEAQPHIYKYLQPASGYKYFGGRVTKWQMLHPIAENKCITFGENDSLKLLSFGDMKTDTHDGYVWNMWNLYDCCRIRGKYLFSIP